VAVVVVVVKALAVTPPAMVEAAAAAAAATTLVRLVVRGASPEVAADTAISEILVLPTDLALVVL
jgi:hypothetical protein